MGAAEVHAGEVFVGREHADAVLAGHAEEVRQTRAHTDEHSVVAFVEQPLHGDGAAAHIVEADIHADGAQTVELARHHVLGQTEGRDAVDQHAARFMQAFEHGHIHAEAGKVARTGDGGRAGADAGHALLQPDDARGTFMLGVVGHEAFEAADGHGLALLAKDALAFALLFLRAHTAAHSRKRAVLVDDAVGFVDVALGHFGDEGRDIDVHGAAFTAEGLLALEAAGGFGLRHLGGVAQRHFIKVPDAFFGGLAGHLVAGDLRALHDSLAHLSPPSSRQACPCRCSGGSRGPQLPACGRSRDGCGVRQSPPCGRRIQGRPRR